MLTIYSLPSAMSHERFREAINFCRDRSDTDAYARFDNGTETECVAVCLSGNGERFATLALFEGANCQCIAVQDPFSPWFTGSKICSGLDEIEAVIRGEYPNARRWIIAGQSSGAYAALILSRRLQNNVTIAFAPQTFDDKQVKGLNLIFPPTFNVENTPDIVDVAQVFRETNGNAFSSQVYIVASYGEHGNPPEGFFWCDPLHWVRMLEFNNVKVILSPTTIHPMLWRNTRMFADSIGYLSEGDADHDEFVRRFTSAAQKA